MKITLASQNKVINASIKDTPKEKEISNSIIIEHLQAEDYSMAISLLSKKLEKNPDDIFCLEQRSICLYELANYQGALLDINKAIVLNPSDPALYLHRAFCFAKIQQKDLALIDLKKAYSLSAENEINLQNIGTLYAMLDEPLMAIENLEKALSLSKNTNSNLCLNIAAVYNFDIKDFNKALEYINIGIKKAPDNYKFLDSLYALKGIILYNMDKKPAALKEFNQALEINPTNKDALQYKKLITTNHKDF